MLTIQLFFRVKRMNTLFPLLPPRFLFLNKKRLFGGDATAPSMTQIRIWKHGIAVPILSIVVIVEMSTNSAKL